VKFDIVLAGVGGQGVLSLAAIIGNAAVAEGLQAKQSEVHGMAQRGGMVHAHLRLSDRPIESDLIPIATAELVLGMEPLEALRHATWLDPSGTLITAAEPVRNIPDYPDLERLLAQLRALPHARVIEAERLAYEAGDPLAMNTVLVGAASDLLPFGVDALERAVERVLGRKGADVVRINLAAFRAGRAALDAAVETR
jgi:indolepyruvate ferredoxin oxidoreductase beta subunit